MVFREAKKTRKHKSKTMTIPQLRKAFEHMDRFRDVESFRKEWKKTFGKEITKESAQDYLHYVSSKKGSTQRGGAAPLDYTLRAGADLPYGSYNTYVAGGFGFANQDSLTAQCGKETWPSPPSGIGCNLQGGGSKRKTRKSNKQKGGALPSLSTALSEFMSRPAGMDSPPNAIHDATLTWKGVNTLASPKPEINNLNYTYSPNVHMASVSPAMRTF